MDEQDPVLLQKIGAPAQSGQQGCKHGLGAVLGEAESLQDGQADLHLRKQAKVPRQHLGAVPQRAEEEAEVALGNEEPHFLAGVAPEGTKEGLCEHVLQHLQCQQPLIYPLEQP